MEDSKKITVEEALRRVQTLKKDTKYINSLEEKWRDQQRRFPIIYEGIKLQAESFKSRIDKLRTIKVETTIEEIDRLTQRVAAGKQ